MYSGTTFRIKSGRIIGTHQKFDRVARRHLGGHLQKRFPFPGIREILHFEGLNGPDGLKRKSPGRDEPWHFIDPNNPHDALLLTDLRHHSANLTTALLAGDTTRAAFEAAWLAHAVTDGLTPAHHYPLEEKLEELRGEDATIRDTFLKKTVMPGGGSPRAFIRNNWGYWGAKGAFTTHYMFEWGVATIVSSLTLEKAKPSSNDFVRLKRDGFEVLFLEAVHAVDRLKMYDEFQRKGWTTHLGRQTRTHLAPIITRVVILAWYAAYHEAYERKQRRG